MSKIMKRIPFSFALRAIWAAGATVLGPIAFVAIKTSTLPLCTVALAVLLLFTLGFTFLGIGVGCGSREDNTLPFAFKMAQMGFVLMFFGLMIGIFLLA